MNWNVDGRQRLVCRQTSVEFQPNAVGRVVPLLLAFVLLGPELITALNLLPKGERPAFLEEPIRLWLPLALCVFAWVALEGLYGRGLRIDELGVTEQSFFRTRHLDWRQIRDFGYAYAGFGTARLYFADERTEADGSGRRRRSGGRCCAIRLRRTELRYAGQIMNVCRQYTRVRPYLCTEDGKLVGRLKDR